MEVDDPFFFITDLCQVSDSQEKLLRSCPFAFQSEEAHDGSGQYSLEPTGILMMSPPESHKECISVGTAPPDNNDVFHTPPEGSSLSSSQEMKQSVIVDLRRNRAIGKEGNEEGLDTVDLERGTNLGFSLEAELTERTGISSEEESSLNRPRLSEASLCKSTEIRVSKRGIPSNVALCQTPLKISKALETPRSSLITDAGEVLDILVKSAEKLKSLSEKSEILDENLNLEAPRGCLGTKDQIFLNKFTKSMEKLYSLSRELVNLDENTVVPTSGKKLSIEKTKNLGYVDKHKGNHPCQESGLLQNPETEETLLEMNGGKIECCKESSTMRKIEFSTKLLDSFKIFEADGGCSGSRQDVSREKQNREAISNTSEEGSAKKRMDDIDKFRYVPSTGALCCESKKDAKRKRALPASVCGKENAGEDEMESDSVRCSSGSNEPTLFDVLRILTQDCYHDPSLEKLTIFEAAKRRGLTFP